MGICNQEAAGVLEIADRRPDGSYHQGLLPDLQLWITVIRGKMYYMPFMKIIISSEVKPKAMFFSRK
ncbi:unnamed protein product [Urochloa humidicola]